MREPRSLSETMSVSRPESSSIPAVWITPRRANSAAMLRQKFASVMAHGSDRARSLILASRSAGAAVGAGSVVIQDVPPHTLVFGNPARVIRTIERSQREISWTDLPARRFLEHSTRTRQRVTARVREPLGEAHK